MDIRYAFSVLWPRIWILIAAGVISAALALVGTSFVPPSYESRATLLVGQSSGGPPIVYEDLLAAQILASTYGALGTTTPVLNAVRDRVGISISTEELRERVRVEGARNSPLIVISATFPTAGQAASVANALAEETAAIGANVDGTLQVSVVDPAEPPARPISPRPVINAAVAAGFAVLVSAGLLLALSMSRPTNRTDGADHRVAVGDVANGVPSDLVE